MFARVRGSEFKEVVSSLLDSASKVTLNIRYYPAVNTLAIQSSGSIVLNKILPVIESKVDENIEITIELTQLINLIKVKEDVDINIEESYIRFSQDGIVFRADRVHEERVEDVPLNVTLSDSVDVVTWLGCVNETRHLDGIVKTLMTVPAPIMVYNNIAYVMYSNTIYTSEIQFPDVVITSEVARSAGKCIGRGGNCKYEYDDTKKMFRVQVSGNEYFYMPCTEVNKVLIQNTRNIIVNMEEVCTIDFTKYTSDINVLTKALKKAIIDLIVTTSGIGLYASTGKHDFTIGDTEHKLFTIRISVQQLSAMVKLFGGSTNVKILKGNNAICIQQSNSEKRLIIAGMLF